MHERWRERLGLSTGRAAPGAVWLVAASVGEVRAASALLPYLKGPVLLSADTEAGRELALKLQLQWPGLAVVARPLDVGGRLAPLWAELRPRLIVWVESSFWPNLSRSARRDGVPQVRVSARPSRGLFGRWSRLSCRGMAVFAKDEAAQAGFARVGVRAELGVELKRCLPLAVPAFAVVPGQIVGLSTYLQEDLALVQAWLGLPEPRPALILAPRRLERVPALLAALPMGALRRSELGVRGLGAGELLVLDSLGEAAGLLGGAGAALIGGSFDQALGSHSAAEAVRAGVPVIHGPFLGANAASYAEAAAIPVGSLEGLGAGLKVALNMRVEAATEVSAAALGAAVMGLAGAPGPERSPRPWARPLVPLVWAERAVVRRWRALSPAQSAVPVVVVGSLCARGGGKTLSARWVAAELAARGHRVGMACRGLGRAWGARCSWRAPSWALGDEAALCAQDGHQVVVGCTPSEALRMLGERGVSVVVVEDGLLDPRWPFVRRLAVVDARFPGARGLLPAGEGRHGGLPEGCELLVHHRSACFPGPPGWTAERERMAWQGQALKEGALVAAFCGIARPADFFASLGAAAVRCRALADHHRPSPAELKALRSWAGELPLVCTAKDAARLSPEQRVGLSWQDLRLSVRGVEDAWFDLG